VTEAIKIRRVMPLVLSFRCVSPIVLAWFALANEPTIGQNMQHMRVILDRETFGPSAASLQPLAKILTLRGPPFSFLYCSPVSSRYIPPRPIEMACSSILRASRFMEVGVRSISCLTLSTSPNVLIRPAGVLDQVPEIAQPSRRYERTSYRPCGWCTVGIDVRLRPNGRTETWHNR